LLGTLLGLGIYQQFLGFIDLIASIVPPLIGPVIMDYYVVNRDRFDTESPEHNRGWNIAAFVAFGVGAASTRFSPDWAAPSLVGLVVSMVVYVLAWYALNGRRSTQTAG
jgi:cytosine permease